VSNKEPTSGTCIRAFPIPLNKDKTISCRRHQQISYFLTVSGGLHKNPHATLLI